MDLLNFYFAAIVVDVIDEVESVCGQAYLEIRVGHVHFYEFLLLNLIFQIFFARFR